MENKMRKSVGEVIDPIIRDQIKERQSLSKIEQMILKTNDKVATLEQVLFEKDEKGRMQLFEKIFTAIQDVDQDRIKTEQQIIGKQHLLSQQLTNLQFKAENTESKTSVLEDSVYQLNVDFKAQNDKQIVWQKDFLSNYSTNEKKMIHELDLARKQLADLEIRTLVSEQRIQSLKSQEKLTIKTLDAHTETLKDHISKLNKIFSEKTDLSYFEKEKRNTDEVIEDLRKQAENHGNHFAMVENFVEKYIPVRIQSQISETLQQVLPFKETQTLAQFEKVRFGEMHSIILEDEGFPNLYEKIREIRVDVGAIDYQKYQPIKMARDQDSSIKLAAQIMES